MESKNLDAALAAKNTATDGAYIMAQDASGNTIRIAKADLASVLAEAIKVYTSMKIQAGVATKLCELEKGKCYIVSIMDSGYSGIIGVTIYTKAAYNISNLSVINDLSAIYSIVWEDDIPYLYVTPTTDRNYFSYRVIEL